MNTIELFAGGGGLALGLHEAEFSPLAVVERDKDSTPARPCAKTGSMLERTGFEPKPPKLMNFTLVTRCHCGCETATTLEVSADSAEDAVAKLRTEWEEQGRYVEILETFSGSVEPLPTPVSH